MVFRLVNSLIPSFSGDSLFFSQQTVTLLQLKEGVEIDFDDSTLFLPPNFDEQIAHVCLVL